MNSKPSQQRAYVLVTQVSVTLVDNNRATTKYMYICLSLLFVFYFVFYFVLYLVYD